MWKNSTREIQEQRFYGGLHLASLWIKDKLGFRSRKRGCVTSIRERRCTRKKRQMKSGRIYNPPTFQRFPRVNYKCKGLMEGLNWHLSESHYGEFQIPEQKCRWWNILRPEEVEREKRKRA